MLHNLTRQCMLVMALCAHSYGFTQHAERFQLPYLEEPPTIDGNIEEWKHHGYADGKWDLKRVQASDWFRPKRNKLIYHEGEDTTILDLEANYYMAWDATHLYFGAEVLDNTIDVSDPEHADERWYFKDAIAWFVESPKDSLDEKFGEGDHAFCFVIDTTYPGHGAWWRHGTETESYLEQPLPDSTVEYAIVLRTMPNNLNRYVLEVRVAYTSLFSRSSKHWQGLHEGDLLGMMIVHCDPDGGDYGGHLMMYGTGDHDASWRTFELKPGR